MSAAARINESKQLTPILSFEKCRASALADGRIIETCPPTPHARPSFCQGLQGIPFNLTKKDMRLAQTLGAVTYVLAILSIIF